MGLVFMRSPPVQIHKNYEYLDISTCVLIEYLRNMFIMMVLFKWLAKSVSYFELNMKDALYFVVLK